MRILVSDVWSVHNAGDAAILEALLAGLRRLAPQARLQVAAHFPETCDALAGVEVIGDVLAFDAEALDRQLAHRPGQDTRLDRLRCAYEEADLVVSTGGYFLNATPGNPFHFVLLSRLLHFGWARSAGVPVAVLGQSIGPFASAELRAAARNAFDTLALLTVRDAASWSYLQRSGVGPQAELTADLAVGLEPAGDAEVEAALERLALPRNALGLSVRSYPGTPTGAFEAAARAADQAVETHGVDVLLIGTTFPPASLREAERALGNDDGIALEAVHRNMRHRDRAALCRESLAPRLLKGVLATCRGLVTTRMHAAILGSTAGVPTAGIAYEPKVTGWFDQLGLPDLVLPLAEMAGPGLSALAARVLDEGPALAGHLAEVLPEVRTRSARNFERLAELLPAAPRPSGWRREALHYDVPHRRLQRILDWIPAAGNGRLLDLGCSAGTLGRLLQGCGDGWTYHGCDASAEAVAEADGLEVVQHLLDDGLPDFDGRPYDIVVASGILEYLEDVPGVLRRIRERLAPGGRLLVSYFNMDHVSRRQGEAFRHALWRNDWRPREFRALLEAAGFRIQRTGWSTAGRESAPDVRDETQAVAQEADLDLAPDARDDLCHTLIYECVPEAALTTAAVGPRVSVVVPCKDRLDLLRPVLEGFVAEAQRDEFELVLVDDGSDPPAAALLEALGAPAFVRPLRHERNRGRGAALETGLAQSRGEVVIFCDGDIVPEPGFVAEHARFHREHPSELATHLGELVWGIEPGAFGRLLGARSNPRMQCARGPLDWPRWYTDNWSFKRRLLSERGLGFDPAFRRWGFEDLALARQLAALGASNTATSRARGRHLKPATLEGFLANFRRSVPNLVHFARTAPDDPTIQAWLVHRFARPEALAAAENLLSALWQRCEELDAGGALAPGPATTRLAIKLSDSAFALGLARGFREEYGEKPPADLELAAPDDRAELLELAAPLALVFLAGARAAQEALSERLLRGWMTRLLAEAGQAELAPPLAHAVQGLAVAELRAGS